MMSIALLQHVLFNILEEKREKKQVIEDHFVLMMNFVRTSYSISTWIEEEEGGVEEKEEPKKKAGTPPQTYPSPVGVMPNGHMPATQGYMPITQGYSGYNSQGYMTGGLLHFHVSHLVQFLLHLHLVLLLIHLHFNRQQPYLHFLLFRPRKNYC